MQQITAFFMSIITSFASFFGIAAKEPVLPAPTDNFVPVVRFFACSDTHVSEDYEEHDRAGRITKLFNAAYDFAEKDPNYKKLDAAMFVGDCTNNGTDKEFEIFEKEIKAGIKDGTTLLAIAADHHDGYVGPISLEKMSAITGLPSDFHVVINGFHFIGISASKNEYDRYAPYQRVWLREELKKAAADNPDKPIFVCNHEHVLDTVYGSTVWDQWGTPYFKDILSQYPQVVHFSGHSHYPINDPRSVIQDKFTTVGTGSMAYAEFRYKADIKIRPEGNGRQAQAWIVEADKDNNVRLTGIDVYTSDILCQYVLPAKCDSNERVFTASNMKALSSPPKFAENAALKYAKNDDGTYTVTAPKAQSTDGFIVFAYVIRAYDKAGIPVYNEHITNNYYIKDCYETVDFTFKAKPGYRVEVTAENAYYVASEPLTVQLG